ncbi:MAG: phosphoribosyltransferase [Candidatus Levybacteria bacterium]|nr:phosphoribosyltransferase [Candidatus Levybacteria bacterium]
MTKQEGDFQIPREERVLQILTDTLVIQKGHFKLTSGRHSDSYLEKRNLYLHTQETSELCLMIANDFKDKGVEIVVGPERGGMILACLVASFLTKMTGKDILDIFAQKKANRFEFHRGQADLICDRNVLVVDDILTTGGSVKEVINSVKLAGGSITGLSVLCNRGDVKPKDIGIDRINALVKIKMESWSQAECGLCKLGEPTTF